MITTLYKIKLPHMLLQLKGRVNQKHTEEVIQEELGKLYHNLEQAGASVSVSTDIEIEEIK